METTPETLNYMIAGSVAFTVIMTVYIFTLYKCWRNLKREYTIRPPQGQDAETVGKTLLVPDKSNAKLFTLMMTAYIFSRYRRWCNLESELWVLNGLAENIDY